MTAIEELRRSGLLDEPDICKFWRGGHFVYESGDHGDTWLSLALLFANPRRLRRAAVRLAEKVRPYGADVVCGPLVGGALVGQWVAHELNAAFVFAEPQPETRSHAVPRELRAALRGKRAVVVDDVINAGVATLACVREIEEWGGSVAAVASLLVRTPGGLDLVASQNLEIAYLAGLPWSTWPAGDCPLCRSGIPAESMT